MEPKRDGFALYPQGFFNGAVNRFRYLNLQVTMFLPERKELKAVFATGKGMTFMNFILSERGEMSLNEPE
ncbi:MAG: hypothetical protein ACOX19_07960 [Fermentimonas sp.]